MQNIRNPKSGTLRAERQHQEHHDIPHRVTDHVDQHGFVFEVHPGPEEAADEGGKDQHDISGENVDAGIKN